jgi:hypothetical protein
MCYNGTYQFIGDNCICFNIRLLDKRGGLAPFNIAQQIPNAMKGGEEKW